MKVREDAVCPSQNLNSDSFLARQQKVCRATLVANGKHLFFRHLTSTISVVDKKSTELYLDGEEDGNTEHGNYILPKCLRSLGPLPFSLKEATLIMSWNDNCSLWLHSAMGKPWLWEVRLALSPGGKK